MKEQYLDIKRMAIGDLTLLQKICCEAYSRNFYDHWEPGGLDYYLKNSFGAEVLARELRDKEIQYYVAFTDHDPVAFMKLNLQPNLAVKNKTTDIELERIYVLPQCKGLKVGKKLMGLAFDIARECGKETFWLSVIDANKEAIAFYTKIGFQFYSKTRLDYPYFKEELKNAWRMSLKVTDRKPSLLWINRGSCLEIS